MPQGTRHKEPPKAGGSAWSEQVSKEHAMLCPHSTQDRAAISWTKLSRFHPAGGQKLWTALLHGC